MPRSIYIRTAEGETRRIPLSGDRVGLGRSHDNELSFPDDPSLSRKHLVLEREGTDDWFVRDLGSKNGTFVDGVPLTGRRRLERGDRITAGHLSAVYDDPWGALEGQVTFCAGSEADVPVGATVVASLEEVLSSEGSSTLKDVLRPGLPGARVESWMDVPAVRALVRAARELGQRRPLPELFELILDLSIEAVGAERGVLLTVEGDSLVTRAVRGEGFRISEMVRDRVLGSRESLLVRDTLLDEALKDRISIVEPKVRTLMAAPLQTTDRVLGLVYVDSSTLVSQLTPADLELLTVIANVAAIRIEQERLARIEELERVLARDLEQAAEIQRGLLPTRPPPVRGIEMAGYNMPCRTVGGDYYDLFPLPDGRVAIVLADVSGKGMSAALLMASLQARVRVLAEEPEDAARLMSRLDRMMASSCPTNRFVTLVFCALDSATGDLAYCNAGHNPPILVRADGRSEGLEGSGMMLGVFPDVGYEERRAHLAPGDLLLLYSDGVTEAESPTGTEFGEGRLAALACECRRMPLASILDAVTRALEEWTAGAHAADDVTLVLARLGSELDS